MKSYFFILFILLIGCKSSIKEKEDEIYSKHLQRHIQLTIVSTKIPDKESDMNLLLFINHSMLGNIRTKKIIDSLYKNDLMQPMMMVSFDGKDEDYGLEEVASNNAKQIKKYNEFIVDELLPFIKKKASIRKFKTVAITGFLASCNNAFDVAFNNDEKIQKVGMFSPRFYWSSVFSDSIVLSTIDKFRKRPAISIWIEDEGIDSTATQFKKLMDDKKSINECLVQPQNTGDAALKQLPTIRDFASFLVWAFSK
jgi:hypothetical protein